jgi:hypothetical protein
MDIAEASEIITDLVKHIKSWEDKLSEKCEIAVVLEEEAIDKILMQTPRTRDNIDKICQELVGALEYGLRLMTHKKHINQVMVSAEGIENPEQFINDLVEKTFKV